MVQAYIQASLKLQEVREPMGHDFEAWENGLQAPLVVFELSVC